MSALDVQIGGEHYKNAKIQPIQYIEANGLGFLEGCVVKRITRHDKPTGKGRQDIEKAIHELQLLLEFRYPHCAECGYPANTDGVHYVTCSQLAATEEHKAEAQNAFDAAIAGEPARTPTGCPQCGAKQVGEHYRYCAEIIGDIVAGPFDWEGEVSEEEARLEAEEPAAAMDDDSLRMQAIGQNGNDGAHYDDPWAGAPEWAKYKAQDENGYWYWYEGEVYTSESQWVEQSSCGRLDKAAGGEPNPNWRDTLIART